MIESTQSRALPSNVCEEEGEKQASHNESINLQSQNARQHYKAQLKAIVICNDLKNQFAFMLGGL